MDRKQIIKELREEGTLLGYKDEELVKFVQSEFRKRTEREERAAERERERLEKEKVERERLEREERAANRELKRIGTETWIEAANEVKRTEHEKELECIKAELERMKLDYALESERSEIEHDHLMALLDLRIIDQENSVGRVQLMEILKREQEVGISLGYKGEQLHNSALLALNEKEIEHREEIRSSISSRVQLAKARVKQLSDRDFRFKGDWMEMREKEFLIGEDEAKIRDLIFEIRRLKERKLALIEKKENLELEWLWIKIETKSKFAGKDDESSLTYGDLHKPHTQTRRSTSCMTDQENRRKEDVQQDAKLKTTHLAHFSCDGLGHGTVNRSQQKGQAVNFDLMRSNTASFETDRQKFAALPDSADELDVLIENKSKCFDETIPIHFANQCTETVSAPPKLDLETETRKDTVVKDLITRVEFGQTHAPPGTGDTLVDGLNTHEKIEADSISCVPLRCGETSSNTVTDFSDRTNTHEKIETGSISCVSLKGSDTSTEFTDRTVSLRESHENVLARKTDIGRSPSVIDVNHDVILKHKIIALCEVLSANTLIARETEVFDPDDSIGSNTDGDNVPMANSFTSDDMTVDRTETEFFSDHDRGEDKVEDCTGTKSSISSVDLLETVDDNICVLECMQDAVVRDMAETLSADKSLKGLSDVDRSHGTWTTFIDSPVEIKECHEYVPKTVEREVRSVTEYASMTSESEEESVSLTDMFLESLTISTECNPELIKNTVQMSDGTRLIDNRIRSECKILRDHSFLESPRVGDTSGLLLTSDVEIYGTRNSGSVAYDTQSKDISMLFCVMLTGDHHYQLVTEVERISTIDSDDLIEGRQIELTKPAGADCVGLMNSMVQGRQSITLGEFKTEPLFIQPQESDLLASESDHTVTIEYPSGELDNSRVTRETQTYVVKERDKLTDITTVESLVVNGLRQKATSAVRYFNSVYDKIRRTEPPDLEGKLMLQFRYFRETGSRDRAHLRTYDVRLDAKWTHSRSDAVPTKDVECMRTRDVQQVEDDVTTNARNTKGANLHLQEFSDKAKSDKLEILTSHSQCHSDTDMIRNVSRSLKLLEGVETSHTETDTTRNILNLTSTLESFERNYDDKTLQGRTYWIRNGKSNLDMQDIAPHDEKYSDVLTNRVRKKGILLSYHGHDDTWEMTCYWTWDRNYKVVLGRIVQQSK